MVPKGAISPSQPTAHLNLIGDHSTIPVANDLAMANPRIGALQDYPEAHGQARLSNGTAPFDLAQGGTGLRMV